MAIILPPFQSYSVDFILQFISVFGHFANQLFTDFSAKVHEKIESILKLLNAGGIFWLVLIHFLGGPANSVILRFLCHDINSLCVVEGIFLAGV